MHQTFLPLPLTYFITRCLATKNASPLRSVLYQIASWQTKCICSCDCLNSRQNLSLSATNTLTTRNSTVLIRRGDSSCMCCSICVDNQEAQWEHFTLIGTGWQNWTGRYNASLRMHIYSTRSLGGFRSSTVEITFVQSRFEATYCFVFKGRNVHEEMNTRPLKIRTQRWLETSVSDYPAMRRHIPEERKPPCQFLSHTAFQRWRPEGQRRFGRPRRRWKNNNIKTDLQEVG